MNTKRIAVKLAAKYGIPDAKRKVMARIQRTLGVPNVTQAHRYLVWVGVGTALDRLAGASCAR